MKLFNIIIIILKTIFTILEVKVRKAILRCSDVSIKDVLDFIKWVIVRLWYTVGYPLLVGILMVKVMVGLWLEYCLGSERYERLSEAFREAKLRVFRLVEPFFPSSHEDLIILCTEAFIATFVYIRICSFFRERYIERDLWVSGTWDPAIGSRHFDYNNHRILLGMLIGGLILFLLLVCFYYYKNGKKKK